MSGPRKSAFSRRTKVSWAVLTGLALLAPFPYPLAAATTAVFGPETFQRHTGNGDSYNRNFPIANPGASTFKLHIDNGGTNDDLPRVTSAVVTLNGVQIFRERDFGKNVRTLEKTVAIRSTNQLSIELNGKPGSGFTLTVLGTDNGTDRVPPTITAAASPTPNAAGWNHTDVTVTFTCSDALSGIRTCPPPVTLTTEGAGQTVSGTAVDNAGNSASTSVVLKIDKTEPSLTSTQDPPPNAAGWNNTPVAVAFTCFDGLSGLASCTPPASVSNPGAHQVVLGAAVDVAGNRSSEPVEVNLDTTAPAFAVNSPASGTTTTDSQVVFTGTATDPLSGLSSVTCNGAPATLASGAFSCTLFLGLGPQSVAVAATDSADNGRVATVNLTIASPPVPPPPTPLAVQLTTPGPGLVTRTDSLTVTGLVSRPTASVAVNGQAATLQNGSFSADIRLTEGTNKIVATAEEGGEAATASIAVRLDTSPPLVAIESPREGDRLVDDHVTVAGTVNDIIPGATVNADDVSLTINGMPALINNRTFLVMNLPLDLGSNAIVASAVDRAGNTRSFTVHVSREPDLAGIRIELAGGNNQFDTIHATLGTPLVVRVLGPQGQVLSGRPIEFTVRRGDGLLDDPAAKRRKVTVLTDGDGFASATFTLGSRTGEGFHRVRATTPGSLTYVDFCATARPGPASRISLARTPPTRGAVGQVASDVLAVIVTDDNGNSIAGLPVTFHVESGGGSFGGAAELTVETDPDGIADATLTLGPDAGTANNQVSATFEGFTGLPAVFHLSGIEIGPAAETSVSGIVQNTAGLPIPGVTIEIEDTGQTTTTGADGSFRVAPVQPGEHHVGVYGGTANDPAHDVFYPYLALAIEAFSGAENALPQVVVLPFLDMADAKLAGGDEDVVLGMKGVPGFSIKIFAHSTILEDGTRAPLLMSSSQVKFDKVPMPPPQGSTPLLVGTLQPGGTRFDPPAQVTYPNVNGLAPGDVADIFAFHHEVGQYVNVGPGTVSEDGTVIVSDPGFGLTEAGWHGVIRVPGPSTQAANGCSARVEWQIVKADGSLGATKTGQVVLFAADDAKKANVRATFGPAGGSFQGTAWTGGTPTVTRSADNASGNVATVTVAAGSTPGTATINSPVYKFTASNGQEATCEAQIDVTVAKVEIEVNKTPAQNDDVIRLKSDVPPKRFKFKSQARVLGTPPSNVTVVLVNPDGRLRLPEATDTTKTLMLPKDGSWVEFELSGETKSLAKDDAKLEAHCDSRTGPVCAKEEATVFLINPAKISVGAAGSYSIVGGVYRVTGGNAANFSSSGTLAPSGLDCTVQQVKDLRVGILQNAETAVLARYYKSPTITWLAGVAPGTKSTVPRRIRVAGTLPHPANDSEASVQPLYDQPGKTRTIDPNSLKPPTGCANAATATSSDSPATSAAPSLTVDAKDDASGAVVGTVTYSLDKASIDASFRTWGVCFDLATNTESPLRETTWKLNVSSLGAGAQMAAPAASDAVPSTAPLEAAPFGNTLIVDPANRTQAADGAATQVFTR